MDLSANGDVVIPLGIETRFQGVDEFDPDRDIAASPLRRLNAKCLAHFGMRPYQVSLLPKDWNEWPGVEHWTQEIRKALNASKNWQADLQTEQGGIDILAPLYAEALKREGIVSATFLICYGDNKSDDSFQIQGLRTKYLLNALANTKGHYRKVVRYDEFARLPALNKPPNIQGYPSLLQNLYALCEDARAQQDALNAGAFDDRIDKLCNEMLVIHAMSNAVERPDDKMTFTWTGGESSVAFCPDVSWQSLTINLDAPPNSVVAFDPYQIPAYMWLRKATWRSSNSELPLDIKAGHNGAIEEMYGVRRLSIFGPRSFTFKLPAAGQIDLEFLIQANDVVIKELILKLSALSRGMRR